MQTSLAELNAQSGVLSARIAKVEKTQLEINDLHTKIEWTKKSTSLCVWSTTAPTAGRNCLLDQYPTDNQLGGRLRQAVLTVLFDKLQQAQRHLETLLE